ncbi:M1 family metallopeptidase [uncultured Arcticibacterium sp.]|uniref:M1 family metallopeptidase n=1 Tax=uncultured Arcticibacterium sp. TaxID=2173042 RepID=UPI0030FCF93D
MKSLKLASFLVFFNLLANAQYTHEDSLKGSVTPERAWWDLKYYDLAVDVDIDNRYFKGQNTIYYQAVDNGQTLQIDLQAPMKITAVRQADLATTITKDGPNTYLVTLAEPQVKGQMGAITINFEGKPKIAPKAPWDGGLTWSKDSNGKPFAATANQGIGASVWWPCKDHMADEVDSMQISITVPDGLWNVSNGQLRNMELHDNGSRTTTWFVNNPINNYGVNINIGDYLSWQDSFQGEKGPLQVSFYVLRENLEKAKIQFKDAYRTLEAFEHWFGPYPFYEDGYKLVEVPYLGMEHQSSVTYGNGYKNGYQGTDLSGTGWGLKWDFIIVHESGHEWFANNITNKDVADMWIHESFTNYSESLFVEYFYGKEAGAEYVIGTRERIQNDSPIIADYGVKKSGSSDMYYKGGNMLHTLRQWINNDVLWRDILRGLNKDFYHQTVTSKQIEEYIADKAGLTLEPFFTQYLRTTQIPKLEWMNKGRKIKYRYTNTVDDFEMPLRVSIDDKKNQLINPSKKWKKVKGKFLQVNDDYYVNTK